MLNHQHKADCTCIECFARIYPFNCLPDAQLNILNENKQIVNYNPNEIIVKQGVAMTHLVAIYSGLAKLYLEGINGHNLILQLIKDGDFIIGPGMYTDFKHHYSLAAITSCTACFVDIQVFLEVMKHNSDFARQSHKSENIKKINALKKIVSLTQKQMPGRIADALLYLHDSIYQSNPFIIELSRRDLADMTALSKESVIRILKQFKDEAIIEVNGSSIEILDMKAVRYFSEVG